MIKVISLISKYISRYKKFLLAIFIYGFIDVILFIDVFMNINTISVGSTGNFIFFVWILSWWKHAIITGINPFFSHFIWYPTGVSLSWNAFLLPAITIPAIPFSFLFNYTVIANLFLLSQPVLASFLCFIFLYKLTKNFSGSFVGGYIYGFSSYVIEEAVQSLPNNITVFFIPLIALIGYKFFKKEIGNVTFVIFSSIVLIFEAGTFLEMFLSTALFLYMTILISYFFIEREKYSQLNKLLALFTISYIIAGIFISPILYNMLSVSYYSGSKFGWFGTSLISLVLPSRYNAFGYPRNLWETIWNNGPWSTSGYIGVPLLIFVVYFLFSDRYKKYNFIKFILLVSFFISLGRNLYIFPPDGPTNTVILPWYITKYIPIIKDMQPHRFFIYCDLIIAMMIAYYSSMTKSSWRKILLLTFIPIFLFPHRGFMRDHIPNVPKFYKSEYKNIIKKNSVVLIYGNNGYEPGMFYQAIDNFYYKIPQGLGEGPGTIPSKFTLWSSIQNTTSKNFSRKLLDFVVAHHVSYIISNINQNKFNHEVSKICSGSEIIGGVFVCFTKSKLNRIHPY